MSLQQAKNALVSSLFELSNAANDAAAATVNFYKIAGVEGIEASALSFANLGETMSNAVKAVTDSIPEASKANGKPAKKGTASDSVAEAEDEKSVKPKKKRAPKDPNAPKKPLTSYLRFNLSVREEMKKERFENGQPCHPAIELNQIIADRWAKVKDSEKEKLQKAWEAEYEDYKKALEKYNASKAEAADEDVEEEPKVEKKAAPKKKKAKKAAASEPAPDYFAEPAEAEEEAEENEAKVEEPAQAPKKSKKRKEKESDDKKLKKKKSHE